MTPTWLCPSTLLLEAFEGLPAREPNATARQEIEDVQIEFDAYEKRLRQMREYSDKRRGAETRSMRAKVI